MTSNGTLAKPNCAKGLRAGRNEIPVTQALNINTRWVGVWGTERYVCRCLSKCMRGLRHASMCLRVGLTQVEETISRERRWVNPPHGQISVRGEVGGRSTVVLDLFPFLLCCFVNQISFPVLPSAKKKLAATSKEQPEKPPKSTAQLFTISWLSEICVILINLGIRRLKYRTCINL